MGRAAIFLVMGLGIAMGFIGKNITDTTGRALEANYSYLKYMYARNLARAAVHAALRTYDRNADPDTTAVVPFAGGTYQIYSIRYSASPRDTIWMKSRGSFADTNYTMDLSLFRSTRPFPTANSAIGIRATPVTFTMTGQASVDGKNYTADGASLVGSGDKPGVATMTSADSTTVRNAGGSNITGSVAVQKDTTTANPAQYIAEYLNNADFTFTTGSISGNRTFGSANNPVIVVCDSPADTNYKVKFTGNVTGYGILAIRGNLELAGTFNWYGLVVVFGEANTVSFGGSGTPGIVGGLIVAQPGTGSASLALKGTGNQGKVKYSSAALANARNIGRLRFYQIINWYE